MERKPIERMTIPLAQLDTWSKQGASVTSKTTYATIKAALEDANAKYTDRNFKVFLQGSYGNDTNIWAESDVDPVTPYSPPFYTYIANRPFDQHNPFTTPYPI